MSLRSAALTLMLFALAPPARADEAFDKLKAEYEAAERVWHEKLSELRKEDGSIEGELPPHPSADVLPKLRELAESRAGTAEAVPVLNYMLHLVSRSAQPDRTKANGEWALDQLQTHHAADAGIADTLSHLRYMWHIDAERLRKFYEAVIEKNPDEEIVARAKFNLATSLYSQAQRPVDPAAGSDSSGGAAKRSELPEMKRAAALFREVASKYAGTKAAAAAEGYIFELDNLQIGMKAPEITGTDADGNEIRLSQFAGQVVVLDFWGFW